MLRVLISRLIQLPIILTVIFFITFALAWLAPGNPVAQPEGRRPPEAVMKQMLKEYHLDSPGSFLFYYVKNLSRGYMGPSTTYEDSSVNEIIAAGLPISAALGLSAIAIALFIGTVAGVMGALKPGSPLDFGSLAIALIGVSLPSFVVGTVLLIVFAGIWKIAPIGAWEWPGVQFWTADFWQATSGMLRRMLLPSLALSLLPAAYIARFIRLGLADVMNSDFIRTARAKGLSRNDALFKHAFKVSFLPVLSYLGPAAAGAMTGSFIVEKIFSIPGLGQDFVAAVLNKDQFLILGLVLTYSTILIVFNLIVDLLYAYVDPRIEIDQ